MAAFGQNASLDQGFVAIVHHLVVKVDDLAKI
jgi:hypothetical protein